MAQFRLLGDHSIANQVLLAGTIQATADVGGVLPVNWKPTGNSEPLDSAALTLFYNAGPQVPGLVRQQWSTIGLAPPVTYWRATSPLTGPTSWQLTGLGAGLAPISQ